MVFPSIPIYADPSNWNQQQQPHGLGTNAINSATRSDFDAIQLSPIALAPNPAPILSAPDPTALTADRGRPTRFPHPESGLNCPRCNSTNTKFCYFNNYSLSQPRHFCRSCRRYWTRGGTLRNVPVGGGSRRNGKRQKPNSSSTATSSHTGKHQQIISNMDIHHNIMSTNLGMKLAESNVGLGLSGMPMQFQPIPFTGAFESSHVLPVQLGASRYNQTLGLSSRNEELLGVLSNTNRTDLGINGGGSQTSLPNFESSSHGIVIQQRSLFN